MSSLLFSNCIFQLNHLVHEKALPRCTVILMKKYVCFQMPNQVQLVNCNLIKGYPGQAGQHCARLRGAAKGRYGRQEDWQPSHHWT